MAKCSTNSPKGERNNYSLCVGEREREGERKREHLKQAEAACNALALMSSVKLINYINSITNKSNNECINLTIFTSQKVAKLLVERRGVGARASGCVGGCFSNDSLCNL